MTSSLPRRLLAEFLGTALLVSAVVGSGVAASRLSPTDLGLQLLQNALATALALGVLIAVFQPVSGAHFNPVVSLAFVGNGLSLKAFWGYLSAQTTGGIAGAVLANLMFGLSPATWSTTSRSTPNLLLGEVVATAGLVVVILALVRTARASYVAPTVGAYIGAACWFTSSTSFANPAVTIGRAFTDTFAGISPASLPGFLLAQLIGLAVAVPLLAVLFPQAQRSQEPRHDRETERPFRLRPQRRTIADGRRLAAPPGRGSSEDPLGRIRAGGADQPGRGGGDA